jgi:hypothetical protein
MVSEIYVMVQWQFIRDDVDARALNFVCVRACMCVPACVCVRVRGWVAWELACFFISAILICIFHFVWSFSCS